MTTRRRSSSTPPMQLLELEPDEPAVDAELDDVALDLLGDAPHHLGALQHDDDVADGDEVLDLERRERGWTTSSRRSL